MTSPNLGGKLHRWALTLKEFDFDVQYRFSSTNAVADVLYRLPIAASVRAAVGRRKRAKLRARPTTAGDARVARDAGSPADTVAIAAAGDEFTLDETALVRPSEGQQAETVAESPDAA
ncbi:hypothetical protein DVH05_001220 [Phytophthora capsici]|nr:hypothetical protein DVH05_001220 [Phytophthora capsici]